MFSPAVRFTILSLALTVACISSVYAGIGDVTSAGEHSKSSVAGSGHEHYLRPDQLDTAGKRDLDGQLAPSLQNVGSHTFPVSTRNKLAQQYINQGLNLSYGFNHMEARRAFQEAARLDPALAMAYWGQALVLGPNINAPMNPNDEAQAFELV